MKEYIVTARKLHHSPVARWADEIKADVDSCIVKSGQLALDFQFLLEISFILGINVIHYWFKRFFLVDLVSIANSIHQCQLNLIKQCFETQLL